MRRRILRTAISVASPLVLTAAAVITATPPAAAASNNSSVTCQPAPYAQASIDPTTGTITCTISELGGTGQNQQAVCVEHSSSPSVIEICDIQQMNTTGNNSAIVDQRADQHGSAQPTATQRARVIQMNVNGNNSAHFQQHVSQGSENLGAQTQTSDQGRRTEFGPTACDAGVAATALVAGVTLCQQNTFGNNGLDANQASSQHEVTTDPSAFQAQDAFISGNIDMTHAFSLAPPSGATQASINQGADQRQNGPNPANELQVVDPHCCNTFNGSSALVNLNQNVNQSQHGSGSNGNTGNSNGLQSGTNEAHCHAVAFQADPTAPNSGLCNVMQSITQNGNTQTNQCSQPSCDTGQQCNNGTCAPCGQVVDGYITQCPPPCGEFGCGGGGGAPTSAATSRLLPPAGATSLTTVRAGPAHTLLN